MNISQPNYRILLSVTGGISITTRAFPSFSPKFVGQVAKNQNWNIFVSASLQELPVAR